MDLDAFLCLSVGLIFSYSWLKLSEIFYDWVHNQPKVVYHIDDNDDTSLIDTAMWLSMESD